MRDLAKRVEQVTEVALEKVADAQLKYAHEILIGVGVISLADMYSRELKLDSFDSETFRIIFRHHYLPR